MKGKIKPAIHWGVVIIICLTAGIVFTYVRDVDVFTTGELSWVSKLEFMVTTPFLALSQYTTMDAIGRFSGEIMQEGFAEALAVALAGIAIIFIVAPFLLAKGYKRYEEGHSEYRSVGWILGASILVFSLYFSLKASKTGTISQQKMTEATSISRSTDHLRMQLTDLAFEASEKMILPQEMGGGDGSFTGFMDENGQSRTIMLSDLEGYNPGDKFSFVIGDDVSDSTITITGISNFTGNNPRFENANEESGKIQISITVTPFEDSLFELKKQNERLMTTGG